MSAIKPQLNLSIASYVDRARLVSDLQDDCVRFERGETIDLNQTKTRLDGLVRALNNDRVAMGTTKVTREFSNAYLTHKKDLDGLTARVSVLSAKGRSVPAWVEPAIYTAFVVSVLALSSLLGSQFASSTIEDPNDSSEDSLLTKDRVVTPNEGGNEGGSDGVLEVVSSNEGVREEFPLFALGHEERIHSEPALMLLVAQEQLKKISSAVSLGYQSFNGYDLLDYLLYTTNEFTGKTEQTLFAYGLQLSAVIALGVASRHMINVIRA